MSDPTNAVKQAREAAAMMRARGAYGEQAGSEPPRREKPSHEQLFRWAVIEPFLSPALSKVRASRLQWNAFQTSVPAYARDGFSWRTTAGPADVCSHE